MFKIKFERSKYYFHIIKLRFWAYSFYLIISLAKNWNTKRKLFYITEYEKNKPKNRPFKLILDTSYYFTYHYFSDINQIDHLFSFNESNIAIGPPKYNQTANPSHLFFTAYYGLLIFNKYFESKDPSYEKILLDHGRFIIQNLNENGAAIMHFDYNLFNLKAPWFSGIAQGAIASYLIRLAILFPNQNYKNEAKKVVDFMISEKSINTKGPDNNIWIEEYPMNPPSMVLNGYIFSIIAIYEIGIFLNDKYYFNLAEQHLDSMVKSIYRFIYSHGIRHNLFQIKFGNINYEVLHTYQFYHLYKITNNLLFLNLYENYNKLIDWDLYLKTLKLDKKIN